jgi:hypothetical protein
MTEHEHEPLTFYMLARVIKMSTDDGLFLIKDPIKLGDTMVVDLYTKHPMGGQTRDAKGRTRTVSQEIVQCMETGGWLPMECLQLLP